MPQKKVRLEGAPGSNAGVNFVAIEIEPEEPDKTVSCRTRNYDTG